MLCEESIRKYRSLHPLFDYDGFRVFWKGEVSVTKKEDFVDNVVFLVASPALIFVRPKSFIHRAKILFAIPYISIPNLKATSNSINVVTHKTVLIIHTEDAPNVAKIIFSVRKKVIPARLYPIHLSLSSDAKLIARSDLDYTFKDIQKDRFSMCCLTQMVNEGANVYPTMSRVVIHNRSPFIVNNEAYNSPFFFPSLITAVLNSSFSIICISSLQVKDLVVVLDRLLPLNVSLKFAVFEEIDLESDDGILTRLAKKLKKGYHQLKIDRFRFVRCSFSPFSLGLLMHIMASFGDPQELDFTRCSFQGDSSSVLFHSIIFHKQFHSLHNFTLFYCWNVKNLRNQIPQIIGSDWAIQSRCLKKISLCRIGEDIGPLFPLLFSQDSFIEEVNLSENLFTLPIPSAHISFDGCKFINLGKCSFCAESFISLFRTLSVSKSVNVSLNSIFINEQSLDEVLNELASNELFGTPFLCSFFFNDVHLSSHQIHLLFQFLSSQSNLHHLSLDGLQIKEEHIENFMGICEMTNLKSLSVNSKEMNNQVCIFNGPLLALKERRMITALSLANQGLDEEALESIWEIVKSGTILLDISGSVASSKFAREFLPFLIQSPTLLSCPWPFHNSFPCGEIDSLKSEYLERFPKESFTSHFEYIKNSLVKYDPPKEREGEGIGYLDKSPDVIDVLEHEIDALLSLDCLLKEAGISVM